MCRVAASEASLVSDDSDVPVPSVVSKAICCERALVLVDSAEDLERESTWRGQAKSSRKEAETKGVGVIRGTGFH